MQRAIRFIRTYPWLFGIPYLLLIVPTTLMLLALSLGVVANISFRSSIAQMGPSGRHADPSPAIVIAIAILVLLGFALPITAPYHFAHATSIQQRSRQATLGMSMGVLFMMMASLAVLFSVCKILFGGLIFSSSGNIVPAIITAAVGLLAISAINVMGRRSRTSRVVVSALAANAVAWLAFILSLFLVFFFRRMSTSFIRQEIDGLLVPWLAANAYSITLGLGMIWGIGLSLQKRYKLTAGFWPISHCVTCGYDLRGSLAAGRTACPECGAENKQLATGGPPSQ